METSKQGNSIPVKPVDKQMNIRQAVADDVVDIHQIYNQYVLNSTATFAVVEEHLEERRDWLQSHLRDFYPVLVAENGEGKIVGWASLSRYSGRCAYKHTAEASVYLAPEYIGRGYGGRLLDSIIVRAKERDFHSLIAVVCTENDASIVLFRSRNFEQVGILKEVGRKFDRWLDVMFLQKMLQTRVP
jgi:phosphinothricin acetyltransferase